MQKEFARRVVTDDKKLLIEHIKYVCGVDVSYKKGIAYCSAAIIEKCSLECIECINAVYYIRQPYIPGLLMLREAPPILETLKLLKNPHDMLLIDGNGQLHPRRCRLSCYIGVVFHKPTIGIAKSLFCGNMRINLLV